MNSRINDIPMVSNGWLGSFIGWWLSESSCSLRWTLRWMAIVWKISPLRPHCLAKRGPGDPWKLQNDLTDLGDLACWTFRLDRIIEYINHHRWDQVFFFSDLCKTDEERKLVIFYGFGSLQNGGLTFQNGQLSEKPLEFGPNVHLIGGET